MADAWEGHAFFILCAGISEITLALLDEKIALFWLCVLCYGDANLCIFIKFLYRFFLEDYYGQEDECEEKKYEREEDEELRGFLLILASFHFLDYLPGSLRLSSYSIFLILPLVMISGFNIFSFFPFLFSL